jgi:hypothetical protein
MKQTVLIFGFFLTVYFELAAQQQSPFNQDDNTISSDTASLDNGFNPLLSTAVALPGKLELYFFNNLETKSTLRTNLFGIDTLIKTRQSRLDHILQVNYGLPIRLRLNIGADLFFAHLRVDSDVNSSLLNIISDRSNTGFTQRNFHSIAPRIRWIPFKYMPELSFQTSVRLSLLKDNLTRTQFAVERTIWQTQAIFYQHFLTNFTAQAQVSYSVLFKNKLRFQTTQLFSYSTYLIFRAYQEKIYLLGSLSYEESREFIHRKGLKRLAYDFSFGSGLYWQLSRKLGVVATTNFLIKSDLGLLTTELIPGSWFRAGLGFNLKLNYRS